MSTHNICFLWRNKKNINTVGLKKKKHLLKSYDLPSLSTSFKTLFNPCPAELIKKPHPLLIFSQSDYLIKVVDIKSHT